MDPCSIPALCITVAGICLKAGTSLAGFIEASKSAHESWQGFYEEIKALGNVLHSISQSLARKEAQLRLRETSDESQHWRNVEISLCDCERSLRSFQRFLDRIKVDDNQFFSKPLQQFKLNQSAEAMTVLRNQIVSYKYTLQVSLQMISMLSAQRTEGSVGKMTTELKQLSFEIRHVRHHLQSRLLVEEMIDRPPSLSDSTLPSYESVTHDKAVRKNLEDCIESAEKVWSSASTVLASSTARGSIDGLSLNGEPLSAEEEAKISQWASNTSSEEKGLYPANQSTSSTSTGNNNPEQEPLDESSSSVIDENDVKDDAYFNAAEELCLIELCREDAARCMRERRYSAAEDAQKEAMRYLERMHANQGSLFENKNEMLEVLATIYYKQTKLSEAAQTLLVLAKTESSPPDRPWKWQHSLAEVYLELENLDKALRWCASAKKGREKEHGINDPLFLKSVALVAKIYELKGEKRRVETLKHMYSKAFLSKQSEENRQTSRTLLKENGFDESSDPAKAVEWAAAGGQTEALQFLIKENRQDSTASTELEKIAFISAAAAGKLPILEALLDQNINLREATDSAGSTALLVAALKGHEEVARLLLERNANVGAIDQPKRRTALHLAQYRSMNEDMTKLLIEKGADVNARDAKKVRPLHIAAERGDSRAALILLKNGADIHARDDTWKTALHLAVVKKELQVVRVLLDHGAEGDRALVGISKAQSTPDIYRLVEEKVKQFELDRAKQEKERKRQQKESKEKEKEGKRKSSTAGHSLFRSRTTPANIA